jgi:hypothetical protein
MWSVWSVQNTERTVPSTHEIEIVLRNPSNKNDTLSYFIDVEDTDFNRRWLALLKNNLKNNAHLEKNYCWLGWADSPRDADYLCRQINNAIWQINRFNSANHWAVAGLKPYKIDDYFSPELIMYSDKEYPVGRTTHDPNNLGLMLKHEPMNRLHRYFEDLQGETWNLSAYYKLADYETKWAIRQLNDLCHELESWVMSNRKKTQAPEWQRPSQITTFLNAPRQDLQDEDYELFLKTRYDREFGGVYLHWAQVGKTQFEVFRDEHGADIDAATCSAINSLKFYSGEFDVEWGRDINETNHDWHRKEQTKFREWLTRNGFNWDDPKLSLGHIKLGQINLEKSFGTQDFFEIIKQLSGHLDIYQIKTSDVAGTFDYVWSDDNYKQMQIDFLRPGYDWSKRNA